MKETIMLKSVVLVFATVFLLVCITMFLTSCKSSSSSQGTASEDVEESADDTSEESVTDPEKEVLDKVVPADDFDPTGEYQDQTSQRAEMSIMSEDGEDCKVLISWSSGAAETTIWQFEGKFDRKGGMIPYENCQKIHLSWDEDGNESEEVVYKNGKGALLYYENGFHWDDKEEEAGKDCYFVKPE